MRILVLTNLYPPHHYGGYELACRDVVHRWRDQGHEVEVVTGDHRRPHVRDSEEPGVTRGLRFYWADHELLDPAPIRRLGWERANHRLWGGVIDRFRPDVVSVWNHGTMSYALLAEVVDRGVPMALVVADDWLSWGPAFDRWTSMFEHRGRPGRLAGRVVRALTGVRTAVPDLGEHAVALFASEWLRQRAAARSMFRFRRSAVVHWGIDPARFPADVPTTARPFDWHLLFVGRIDERKGVLTAVRALAELPDAHLEIVGGGSADERARLDALVDDRDLAGRVTVHELPADEVRDRYLDSDVALFPSEWDEPFGLVGLEAMACGTPLVATGTGGSSEYLEHDRNALVVPPADAAALAAAVRRIAVDPTLRARLRSGGTRTASSLTLPRMADALLAEHVAASAEGLDRPA